jgi:site-specific DNA-methyltransferase (adenine-specific)
MGRTGEKKRPKADIFLEDCIVGMHHVERGSVDVIVTSPPYNLGIDYSSYNDKIPRECYLDWMEEWAKVASLVLSPKGSLFLNLGGKPSDPWGPFDVMHRLRPHFVLQNTIHWIKSIALSEASTAGHYKPINSKRYINNCHEFIFHLTFAGDVELDRLAIGVPYKDKSNIGRWAAGQALRCRGNTWFVPYKTIQNRRQDRPHPATFPPQIPEMCIKLHGIGRVARVMDPFMGLGNTAQACKNLGVDFIGFEVDKRYFEEMVGKETTT